ncbi:uncharacterized protein DUF3375 [Tamilnaduibacter salinus]|uniref:Uncharacterized protein DUF3375 n=1 Tax=Tamilnaduibacter salinus TaxID=1484056 RepID=A0A2U1CX84_9GAMM|nr:DUF3375 domain-containing protein [Tamilnaduibacter salinus]PVY76852.1 uncharacterized protein DUF3375 [Tamilnaduibacter salinus]
MPLDFRTASQLRHHHPAWRLLLADHSPLIASFLDAAFIEPNVRTMPESRLQARLEDHLFQLRESEREEAFPRSATDYLNDWADNHKGWLRKFYPIDSDEAHFDLTPAAEKAIGWLTSLTQRHFVGTESRLKTIFDLLGQILEGVETDAEARIAELERRQSDIQREIDSIRDGHIDVMGETAVRERFQQLTGTARELLSDFREVEHNFRQLDRQAREQITTWEGSKGQLLDHIFGERDAIADSDQGKTFRAFWDFLMSPSRQEELTDGLEQLFRLDEVRELSPDPRLKRIHFDWLEAGEQTQRTVARLSEQLRRFLDDQAYLENKRIMQVIQDIEGHALALRDDPPGGDLMSVESPTADIRLPMERPLFSPPLQPVIDDEVTSGDESAVDPDALFNQVVVDDVRLRHAIDRQLQGRDQVTLAQVIDANPLEVGLAELVAYLSLAGSDERATFDDQTPETIAWQDESGLMRRARLPRVLFTRQRTG